MDLSLPAEPQRGQVRGVVDTGDHLSAAGHEVRLVSESGSRLLQATDASGAFLFGDVAPGPYYLEVEVPGFAALVRPGLRVQAGRTLELGALAPTWLQHTAAEGLITGKVVVNGSGDAAGGQVEFLLQPTATRLALAAIGLGGEFVQRVPPGTYTLRASHPLYVTRELPDIVVGEAQTRDLTAEPLALDINPASVAGRVLRERDGALPTAAAGALVTLSNGATTVTDAEGQFLLQGQPGGTYRVRVTLAGHTDPEPTRTVTLTPGEQSTLEPLTLALARGTVAGQVVLADGQPAQDVTVALTGTPYGAVAVPDPAQPSRASFRIANVPVGTYELSASKARYSRPTVGSVTVQADTTVDVGTLTLVLLSGEVVIDDGVADNTPGYTRTRQVMLLLGSMTGVAAFRASEDPDFTGVDFQPYTGPSQPFTLTDVQGPHTVYVQYKDGSGSASPALSGSVTLDSVPPDTGAALVGITTPSGNAFTNSVSVTLQLTLPADATGVRLTTAADATACNDTDLAGVPPVAPTAQRTFVLPAGDGLKRVCAQLLDAAGNASALFSRTVTLDTQPPTAPLLLTQSQVVNLADDTAFTLRTAAPVSDTNFRRYERLGGKDGSWTADATSAATTSFIYRVVSLDTAEAGVANVLRLRAVDLAGNVSPEASVVITTDIAPPKQVTLDRLWVDNTDGQVAVHWRASSSPDVVAHRVYYGSASGSYVGTYAQQGASPFQVGNVTTVTLSGLPNGTPTYVTVRPVDAAGNEGPAPSLTTEVLTQPNRVSPTLIASLILSNVSRPTDLTVQGDLLYVAGTGGGSGGCGSPILRVVDLRTLVSPLHGGHIQTAPAGPALLPTELRFTDVADSLDCTAVNYNGVDFEVDGQYGFLASAHALRILSLARPESPTVVATLDLSPMTYTHGIAVRGDTLFVQGRQSGVSTSRVVALSLAKLYDGDPTTFPTMGDAIGTATNGVDWPVGLAWTRNRLVQTEGGGPRAGSFSVADALDGNATTPWDNTDYLGLQGGFDYNYGPPVASGNYLYVAGYSQLGIFRLDSLWAGSAVRATDARLVAGWSNVGQFEVLGGQTFLVDNGARGLRAVELTNLDATEDRGIFSVAGYGAPIAAVHYGPYMLVGTIGGELLVLETATPRSLRLVTNSNVGGPWNEVVGGFLYSTDAVQDLQASWPPPALGRPGGSCALGTARIDDTLVYASGGTMQVVDLAEGIDRNPATTLDYSDSIAVTMPPGTRVMDVAAVGSWLLAAEKRSDGTWLEVFDARALRDQLPGTLSLASSRGAFKVTPNVGRPALTVHRGRAFVGLEAASGPGLYVVDVRAMLDDDSTTQPTATSLQGYVPSTTNADPWDSRPPGVRQTVVRGNYAYMVTAAGFEVADVSLALDGDPATVVPSDTPQARVDLAQALALDVYGSYALVVPIGGTALQVMDISRPLTPVVAASLPFSRGGVFCDLDGVSERIRAGVSIHGSRAYVTSYGYTGIFELE